MYHHHNENSSFYNCVCFSLQTPLLAFHPNPLASRRDKLITQASSWSSMRGPPADPAQSLEYTIMTNSGSQSHVCPLASRQGKSIMHSSSSSRLRGLPVDPAQSLYHHNENSGFRDHVCPLASKRDKLITHASSSSGMQSPPAHPAQSLGVIIMTYGGFHGSVFP